MKVVLRDFYGLTRGSSIEIVATGDHHFGTAACDRSMLAAEMARIARTPNCYWLGMGDYGDLISVRDRRFDPRVIDPAFWSRANQNIAACQSIIRRDYQLMTRPAMHRCLGLLYGNHEETSVKQHESDWVREIVDDYREWCSERHKPLTPNPWAEPLTSTAVLILRFHRVGAITGRRSHSAGATTLVIYATHGAGGAQTMTGKVKRLEGAIAWLPQADIYLSGHFHDRMIRPVKTLALAYGNKNAEPMLVEATKWVVLVPSFFRTHVEGVSTYGDARGYSPSVLGGYRFTVWPFGQRVRDTRGRGSRKTSDLYDYSRPVVTATEEMTGNGYFG